MEICKIKFTPTETKILSAFSKNITSYKGLSLACNANEKTIRNHIDRIKIKISGNSKSDVFFFMSKCSANEIKQLNEIFEKQFIFNQFSIVAEKIYQRIAPLNPTCICSILFDDKEPQLEEIKKNIKLFKIKLDWNTTVKNSPKPRSNIRNNNFHIYISKIPEELAVLSKENTILICLGEKQPNYKDIFFYNKDNIKELYHYIITFLSRRYSQVAQLNKKTDLLKSVDNYSNHPLAKEIIKLEKKEKPSHSPTLQSNTTYWKLGIFLSISLFAVLLSIIYTPTNNTPREATKVETLAYNLPPKNQQFTGREDIIKQLEANLDSSNVGVSIQVISGSGGVGKSQLLTEYAYRNKSKNKYNAILWINSHNNSC